MSEVYREVVSKTCMKDGGQDGMNAGLVRLLILNVHSDVLIPEEEMSDSSL